MYTLLWLQQKCPTTVQRLHACLREGEQAGDAAAARPLRLAHDGGLCAQPEAREPGAVSPRRER